MNIEVKTHQTDPEITLLVLGGRLDAAAAQDRSTEVLDAVQQSVSGVIFDLGNVEYVSSAGLRLLLQSCKECTAKGKKYAMIHLQPPVYKIFKLAGFDASFNLYQDDASAIDALWKKN